MSFWGTNGGNRGRAFALLAAMGVASAALQGCGAPRDNTSLTADEKVLISGLTLRFDRRLRGRMEKKLVAADLLRLSRMELDTGVKADLSDAADRYFEPIFGGISSPAVMGYLDDRLNVILSEKTDLESRLSLSAHRDLVQGTSPGDNAVLMASNVGVYLWWTAEIERRKQGGTLQLEISGSTVPIRSTRAGVIQLGQGYNAQVPQVDRIGTLVHEARHSDCVGGLTQADLKRIEGGGLPQDLRCGNLHVKCPEGHFFEGLAACDSVAWGSYAVEGIFLNRMARRCGNCSEEERQLAVMGTVDRYGRVLKIGELLRGELGPPDMTSLGMKP